MERDKPTINEVDFCAQVASTANGLIAKNPESFPFREARVEGYGTGTGRRKRKDLRFFDHNGKLVLCGEVKLPGKPEGRSPYDAKLCEDAEAKADNANVRFFFTWNINTFVLWDRSRWDVPLLNRRIWQWQLGRTLSSPEDVAREDNLNFIKTHFLPNLLRELSEFLSEQRREWLPPDDVFIRSLESHLEWPVQLASMYILEQSEKRKPFDLRVQQWMTAQEWTFVRTPYEEWAKAVGNMAKTLAYVWANRLIFYKALRARFPGLPKLHLRTSVKTPEEAMRIFNSLFQRAVEQSGDYEPLLMPDATDWAIALVFQPPGAIDAWRGLLKGIDPVDFSEVPSDVIGRIFQKLIGPDERHRYGQHFTGDDVVDLINTFCIHRSEDTVFDPACGSGSFLVRAYYRKRRLDSVRPHLDLIGELFGCDIALYPVHLAMLNLAAREINDEANYPRIVRQNFFDFTPPKPFCTIPDGRGGQQTILLPPLDVVVGNPPYVRQEKVAKKDKARFGKIASNRWSDLHLSGRSDLHCYFWPAASWLLKPDGYFGFLTSSSWLDVEYGFALQGWMLSHFRILAIMESAAEPWFEDARVKTCVAILQRSDDEGQRMANLVRFVRFNRKLSAIIGIPPVQNEDSRQAAFEVLRNLILKTEADYEDENLRIIVKTQKDLWADGVRAGSILRDAEEIDTPEEFEDGEEAEEGEEATEAAAMRQMREDSFDTYRAGKWGRYVRAPNLYFEIMRRFGSRFVPLGEVASIRRGITSGCDAFFMPKDVTTEILAKCQSDRAFRGYASGASRKDVESGKIRIIQAGDGSIHPIESSFLAPEVHSLMNLDRPIVRAADLDRAVLLVGEQMDKLKTEAPWVYRYLRYGMTATFVSSKSKPVPVPKRSTCVVRDPWYDLTGLAKPAFAFWPKGQQYRHMAIANPSGFPCNCRLYEMQAIQKYDALAFAAILNSTLVALWRNFYGRYTGTEGALETMVIDARLIEVPTPLGAQEPICSRLKDAFSRLCLRPMGDLVEEQLMDCHTPERARKLAAGQLSLSKELQEADRRDLDDAVFELLGVSDPQERTELLKRLYEATARHFRDIRVVEIEKMQQRGKSDRQRFSIHDLAGDVWDAAELEDTMPLDEWIGQRCGLNSTIVIPGGQPAMLSGNPLFEPKRVYFGKAHSTFIDCLSREQAELVLRLANLELSGESKLPRDPKACIDLLTQIDKRLQQACDTFGELAKSRTSDDRVREQITELLLRWFVHGHETENPS